MKKIFDDISASCSELVTKRYSTSFSLGIKFLGVELRQPIYSIYGFVRCADEIVDSFHGFDKKRLLEKFRADTIEAIEDKISLNPVLNSFQAIVNKYKIEWELVESFLNSMKTDLSKSEHDQVTYQNYIYGSAEVVGLMCLKVFVNGDKRVYEKLKPYAMSLGSAFQKVNFLRDAKEDFEVLGRVYFPGIDVNSMNVRSKIEIEADIEDDFSRALEGIRQLPGEARMGVYLAYYYYKNLFNRIKAIPANSILTERVRIPNAQKFGLMFSCVIRHRLNML